MSERRAKAKEYTDALYNEMVRRLEPYLVEGQRIRATLAVAEYIEGAFQDGWVARGLELDTH